MHAHSEQLHQALAEVAFLRKQLERSKRECALRLDILASERDSQIQSLQCQLDLQLILQRQKSSEDQKHDAIHVKVEVPSHEDTQTIALKAKERGVKEREREIEKLKKEVARLRRATPTLHDQSTAHVPSSAVQSTPSQSTPPIMIPTDGIHKTVSPKLEELGYASLESTKDETSQKGLTLSTKTALAVRPPHSGREKIEAKDGSNVSNIEEAPNNTLRSTSPEVSATLAETMDSPMTVEGCFKPPGASKVIEPASTPEWPGQVTLDAFYMSSEDMIIGGAVPNSTGGRGIILTSCYLRPDLCIFWKMHDFVKSNHFEFVVGFEYDQAGPLPDFVSRQIVAFSSILSSRPCSGIWQAFVSSFGSRSEHVLGRFSPVIILRDPTKAITSFVICFSHLGDAWGLPNRYKCPECAATSPVFQATTDALNITHFACTRCYWGIGLSSKMPIIPPPTCLMKIATDTFLYSYPVKRELSDYVGRKFREWRSGGEGKQVWKDWLDTERGRAHLQIVASLEKGVMLPRFD